MMGLAELFTRSTTQYVATNTTSGATEMFTVTDLTPDWQGAGEYQGGMSNPGAWRCAIMLSDLLGGIPWHAYEERPGAAAVKVTPTPLLLEQPSPPDVRVTTFAGLALDLVWSGNAVGVIATRDPQGWPTSIVPVPADQVFVRRARLGEPWAPGEVLYDIAGRTFAADDVIHIKGPTRPGCLRGMGVLEYHLNTTLRLASDQQRTARSVGNAGVPTGLLKSTDPDFDEDDAKALKAAWLRNQRERTVAVLNSTTDFEALAWNPTESQLLEARKFSLHEVALIFGVDPAWLGVSSDSQTYQNQETKGLDLLKFSSLSGHLARFEQTLSAHMPPGTWVKAQLDALLRADTLSRYQAHEIGIRAGFLTRDEARELEDRAPLTPAQRKELAPAPAPTAAPASTEETPK